MIRSQGSGGQNVNKVSTAIHLRFDIKASSLTDAVKARLLQFRDHRITKEGVIIIKAQGTRSQDQNKAEALERLKVIILAAMEVKKRRIETRPTKGSQRRRLNAKTQQGKRKLLRKKSTNYDD